MTGGVFLDDNLIHDLKSPLFGITANLDLLRDYFQAGLNKDQQSCLVNINDSAAALSSLVMEMQVIIKVEDKHYALERSSFTAEDLLKELAGLSELARSRERRLKLSADKDLSFDSDKGIVLRILKNLLNNSIRQSGKGTEITLAIKGERDNALIEITDANLGIPADLAGEVFAKDFKINHPDLASKISQGAGFYFCGLLAKELGGELRLEVLPERGTKYLLRLPLKSQGNRGLKSAVSG